MKSFKRYKTGKKKGGQRYPHKNFGMGYFENPEEKRDIDKKLTEKVDSLLHAKGTEKIKEQRQRLEGYTEALTDLDLLRDKPGWEKKEGITVGVTRLKTRFGKPESWN